MKAHTRGDSQQAATLTDAFVDRFAIAGPPAQCIARLEALAALGLDKVAISGSTRGSDPKDAAVARQLMETEVLPHFAGNRPI
jgi:5,10-methylenetetrahydromethanopterin reductase